MKKILILITLIYVTVGLASSSHSLLTLTTDGDFRGYTHFGFFIDADNNQNTGYSKGKIKGADFLVQENGLYKYPKGAKGWKWNRIDKNFTVTHTSTNMSSEVPLSIFGLFNSARYNASISTANWKKNKVFATQSVKVKSTSPYTDYNFILGGVPLYKTSHVGLFIDADHNTYTGYSKNGIVGADILIQNGEVYTRKKPDHGRWSDWKKVGKSWIDQYDYLEMSVSFDKSALHGVKIDSKSTFQAFSYNKNYTSKKSLSVNSNIKTDNPIKPQNPKIDFINITKNSRGGIEIVSIKSNKENVLQKGSKLFEFQIENLSNQSQSMIDSLHGWGSIVLNKTSSQIKTIFSNPQNRNLPTTLKVISTINLEGTKSKWDIEVNGVGNENSIVDIFAPKLRFNILHNGKFLIPKYTGKIIDVESEKIDRNMLYPAGWQSTMQFLAYYNNRVGIYLGNHDPKASTKRFRVLKKDGAVEYSTNIIPPNKTLANNNFKLSGVFELDSFSGDWFEASQIYKDWASKNALYWPKMTPSRIKRQHKIGEVALWTSCIYKCNRT